MKLTRAIPALLALSMLTGCDVNAFMPKNGQTDKNTIQNPGTTIANKLNDAELKSVAAFQGGLVDAAGQGLAAAGTVNALKSVAALKSVNAYRISSLADFPTEGNTEITWQDPYTSDNNQFTGKMGKGTLNGLSGWYLDGAFTLIEGFTANGQAMLQASSDSVNINSLGDYQASASIDITVANVPAEIADLKDSRIELELGKLPGASSVLVGDFKITKGDVPSAGSIEIELLSNTWKVVIPSKDDEQNQVFISLNREPSGGGVGRVYGAKNGEVDYDNLMESFSWGSDGKVKLNGKVTDVVMPF